MATFHPFFLKLWRLLHIFSPQKKTLWKIRTGGFLGLFFFLRHSVESRQKNTLISNQSNGQSFFSAKFSQLANCFSKKPKNM
jgi:hypothetical protein